MLYSLSRYFLIFLLLFTTSCNNYLVRYGISDGKKKEVSNLQSLAAYAPDDRGNGLLHWIVLNPPHNYDNYTRVQLELIRRSCNRNVVNMRNNAKHSALDLIVLDNNVLLAKHLLDMFQELFDINTITTAANLAVINKHIEMLKAFFDVPRINNNSQIVSSTLWQAARNGHEDIVKMLLGLGMQLPEYTIRQALEVAAEHGHRDIVKMLLNSGVQLDGEIIMPALEGAAGNGYKDIIETLFNTNVQLNSEMIMSAFEIAACNGYKDIVEMLLGKGVQLDGEMSRVALWEAAINGHLDVVNLIVRNIQFNKQDINSAVAKVKKNNHQDIVDVLSNI
ncbi:MAG: ankyrin repeat domain-containing protein [Candidatus Cardinium sp.]|uniref:ankyrin repeat domain-containing protein n=1 Tax=Cardinium endosymbiont of Dermatophagoides farinae TaxID=2597823 RepID=UPI00118405B1|nr:ankyrin repeat domain-containing protein [Cardinium endosymbiont of Dermatophagoides farinae]TSJ80907.1 ankyrin repeat domain-containing protein [Cardinium endosymbiont of Dermatophagoides farinae]UWW96919.1 MAG: ankyrin repeat domain-containing protein [Candidatus Cardinium sp.]